jgi:hypothetical protein
MLSSNSTLSDFIPFVSDKSNLDFPLLLAFLLLVVFILAVGIFAMFGYCHFGKKVGICEKCWD